MSSNDQEAIPESRRPDRKWVPVEHLLNREVSWLRFNMRVLSMAEDESVPLVERVKFLAIVNSNMDEFFMKRVGGLKLWKRLGIQKRSPDGLTPTQQLEACGSLIKETIERQERCLTESLLPQLKKHGIHLLLSDDEISDEHRAWCRQFFVDNVYPVLTPLAVDASHPFPFISNQSLSLAVQVRGSEHGSDRFVRIKLPRNLQRWVELPGGGQWVPLERVISQCIDYMMPGEEIVSVNMFRVTRSIVVDTGDYQDDLYQDMEERPGQLRREIADQLRERRFAPAVRLEIDANMSQELRRWLLRQLNLTVDSLYVSNVPLGLDDLSGIADLDYPDLKYDVWRPRSHPRLVGLKGLSSDAPTSAIFRIIRQGDVLVHHPYHDFDGSVLHFIRAAAEDPHVLAIKQTLYRTASGSPVVHALVRAAEMGKQVAVLVELKARLDEHRNLRWAQVLESAGAHVSYGVEDLKTHTKLVLVVRQESSGVRRYAHIGTGNYHSGTARAYTDLGLLTADPEVCDDVAHLFNLLTGNSRFDNYKTLLVAPKTMRPRFLELIDREIQNARRGHTAHVWAKMNQLQDPIIIGKLYEASQAGVHVDLIVRGFCTLRPGLPGVSDNIRVTSVVGRFLEHHRVFAFHNDGACEYFLGSADWMSRNLSNRVEAVVEVRDSACTEELKHILRVYDEDNTNAWKMLPDGRYERIVPKDGEPRRVAQEVFMHEVAGNEDEDL